MEALRDLCRHAAPLVARLRELEELRAIADGLGNLVHEGALCEVRLREAQDEVHQLRAHDALRGQLMAGVNHALRTPLVALRGYARLLLATEGGPEGPARQPLEVISRNADRVVDVAKNLWMPARGSVRLARVDLSEIWERVLTVARTVAVGRGLTMVERAPERPASVVGDAARLEQMLSRLMEAMLMLAPLGQTLRTELREETARTVVSVEVDEIRPESSALDGAAGPDMWLDSVREAANRQGGWMTVERGPDAGLKLSIVLPRIEVER
jgi:C4-dicarboxylate-specific signal transduction histidine kinase